LCIKTPIPGALSFFGLNATNLGPKPLELRLKLFMKLLEQFLQVVEKQQIVVAENEVSGLKQGFCS
jgi:hypothetical protein